MPNRFLLAVAAVAASVLALTGCASAGAAKDDGRIQVVASTDVYGQIAQEIGGDAVTVASLVNSPSQDPHEFEASASDQLAVDRADLVLQNGAGYDSFMTGLIQASDAKAPVLTAVEYSSAWPGGDPARTPEGFNEHVWYDPITVSAFATAIAGKLVKLAPKDADAIRVRLDGFTGRIGGLTTALNDLEAAHGGDKIFVTEPVPLYLTDKAALVNVSPDAFSEAVEAGEDVPPRTLLEAKALLASGDVKAVIVNAQAGGAETTTVMDAAKRHGIPVLEFSETLPKGLTYVEWMQRNIDQLTKALS